MVGGRRAESGSPRLAAARIWGTAGQLYRTLQGARADLLALPSERLVSRAARLQRVCAELCRVHGFELQVEGGGPLPSPVVLIANHVSYVDPLVLAARWRCTVIAKGEVRGWPLIGAGAAALGTLFVDRGDVWSGALALRQAYRALRAGVSVLGFPEGTTSDGEEVLPFHRGLFGIARLAGVPLLPLAVRYADPELRWYGESWFLPHYLGTALRPSSRVRVRVGRPIVPLHCHTAEGLAQRARAAVGEMLQQVYA